MADRSIEGASPIELAARFAAKLKGMRGKWAARVQQQQVEQAAAAAAAAQAAAEEAAQAAANASALVPPPVEIAAAAPPPSLSPVVRQRQRMTPRMTPPPRKPHDGPVPSVRYSHPSGLPIDCQTDTPLLKAAGEFDEAHTRLAEHAYEGLRNLASTGGRADLTRQLQYHDRLSELKRHRFVQKYLKTQLEEVVVYRASAPSPRRKALPQVVHRPSVWNLRDTWADSKDWYDTPEVVERAFALDWSRALRTHKLASFIVKNDDGESDEDEEAAAPDARASSAATGSGDGAVASDGDGAGDGAGDGTGDGEVASDGAGDGAVQATEGVDGGTTSGAANSTSSGAGGGTSSGTVGGAAGGAGSGAGLTILEEVAEVLVRNAPLIYRTFDIYASSDSKLALTEIGYNAFKLFVQDCSLDVPGSAYCDSAHYDQLFIKINSVAASGGRKLKGDIEVTAELVGRYGMATDIAGRNEDKRALSRHEWLNVLVRIAVMRYVQTQEESDVGRAIERLVRSPNPTTPNNNNLFRLPNLLQPSPTVSDLLQPSPTPFSTRLLISGA